MDLFLDEIEPDELQMIDDVLTESESIDLYLSDIKKIPTFISNEQEINYVNLLIDGDIDARNKLIVNNLKLVINIAKRLHNLNKLTNFKRINLIDLISEGNLGLIKASEKFDPSHGAKFSTYAYYWIFSFIASSIRNVNNIVHIPDRIIKKNKINENSLFLNSEQFHSISYKEHSCVFDELGCESTENPISNIYEEDKINFIKNFPCLSDIEKKILFMRFGIDTDVKSFTEIGKELNFTRQRAQQIFKRSLETIKKIANENNFKLQDFI